MGITKIAVVILCLFVLFVPFLVLSPERVENHNGPMRSRVGAPTVTVTLDQAEGYADVSPGASGNVTFTGNVTCEMPPEETVEKVLVSLEANAGGWPWTLEPSTMTFDRVNTTEKYTTTVRVPPRTSACISQQLTISGKAVNRPGALQTQIYPATAMINVNQFYNFTIECTKSHLEVDKGDQFSYQLKITNNGNDQDTIKIRLLNEEELEDEGFAIMLSQTEYIIDEGSNQVVKISVTPPNDIYGTRDYEFELRFSSFQGLSIGKEFNVDYTLTATIGGGKRESSGVGGGFMFASMAVMAVLVLRLGLIQNKKKKRKGHS